jgi:Dyp-type peroxidase family
MTSPNPAHIQNLVVKGFDTHHSRYFLLTIQHAAAARQFLRTLLAEGWVVHADKPRDQTAALQQHQRCPAGIGFTFAGLQALELPTPYLRLLQDLAPAFAQGAAPRAAHRLADTGPSAAALWEPAFQPHTAHVFITLHADHHAELLACSQTLEHMAGTAFTGWATPLDGAHLGRNKKSRREHFGFLDGITNPLIAGIHQHTPGHAALAVPQTLHAPGEFLLGHRNYDGYNRWLIASEPARVRQFFADGSFSALRKMAQDTDSFAAFVQRQASPTLPVDAVRAKLLGRWDDGQVVTPSASTPPTGPKPSTRAGLNDFDFRADPHGLGCPFGAHIRRMNPREDPVVPVRKRPLIRRGIPYGPTAATDQDAERGLLGLFFCASLEDQFEHLLAEWGNKNPFGVPNPSTAKDPIVGNHEGRGGVFDIPTATGPHPQISGFTPFVTTKGTLYSFFPSLPALAALAETIRAE